MIRGALERRVEFRTALAETALQSFLGKSQVQPQEGIAGSLSGRPVTGDRVIPPLRQTRIGHPADDVEPRRTPESDVVHYLEEDEAFGVFLQADQDVALDVVEIDRGQVTHAGPIARRRSRRPQKINAPQPPFLERSMEELRALPAGIADQLMLRGVHPGRLAFIVNNR